MASVLQIIHTDTEMNWHTQQGCVNAQAASVCVHTEQQVLAAGGWAGTHVRYMLGLSMAHPREVLIQRAEKLLLLWRQLRGACSLLCLFVTCVGGSRGPLDGAQEIYAMLQPHRGFVR